MAGIFGWRLFGTCCHFWRLYGRELFGRRLFGHTFAERPIITLYISNLINMFLSVTQLK